MGRFLIALLILAAVAGGVFYFVRHPISIQTRNEPKKATEWTPESIAKDPIGYLASAGDQIKQAVDSLNSQKNSLSQQKNTAEQQVQKNAKDLEQTQAQFEAMRDAYKKAISGGSWPVEVSGKAYQEDELKSQILSLSKKVDSLEAQNKQFNQVQQTISTHVADLERRITEAEAKKAELARQAELAKAKKTLDNLESLQTDIDGLTNVAGSLDAPGTTPSVDQLIEKQQTKGTDEDFRNALLRESRGGNKTKSAGASSLGDGPFFDPQGKPLIWYHITETGDYELFSRPGTHPTLGVPLEPMTPEAAKTFAAWKKDKTKRDEVAKAETNKQAKSKDDDAYRSRYINLNSIPQGGQVALLVVSGKGNAAQLATQGIGEIYRGKGFQVVPNAFTGAFVQGDLFERAFSGDASVLGKLQIADRAARVILAKVSLSVPRPTGTQNLTTVDGTLSVCVSDGKGNVLVRKDYSVPGAGVDADSAGRAATERLGEAAKKDAASYQ